MSRRMLSPRVYHITSSPPAEKSRHPLMLHTDPDIHTASSALAVSYHLNDEVPVAVEVVSFGYRHGVPTADNITDLRLLLGQPELSRHDCGHGRTHSVRNAVLRIPGAGAIADGLDGLARGLLRARQTESVLRIAIGSDHGRHRSVALADVIAERLGLFHHLGIHFGIRVVHHHIHRPMRDR